MTLDKQPNFRPGFHHPSYDEGNNNKYLWWTLAICFALVVGLGYCAVPGQSQNGVVIHIQNFGKPMTPGLPPYRNDPEGIVKSENFYSLMLGSRELRSGYSDLIPYDTIAYTTTSPIDAFTFFTPQGDSTAVIFAAGGYYYTFNSGYTVIIGGRHWGDVTVPDTVVEIQPYTPGNLSSDTVRTNGYFKFTGTGISRFIRDLEIGDSLIIADSLRFKISHIVDDGVLYVDTTAVLHGDTLKARSYIARRGYTDTDGIQPYFHTAKGLLYTGNQLNASQVIYSLDSVLHMRTMGIVDSFLIDTVYTLYPTRGTDTVGARWDSSSLYPHISWDTTIYNNDSTTHTSFFAKEFMLVNRRKAGEWVANQWVESISENPEAYYLRIGAATSPNTGTFFQIKWNDDTAVGLRAWYVDSTSIGSDTATNAAKWNDSIFSGFGTSMEDTIDAADVEGKWAYIYSSAGFSDVVVDDKNTGVLTVQAQGAICYTDDASFPIDTTETMKGMLFLHLTGNDIDFPADTNTDSRFLNQYHVIVSNASEPGQWAPRDGDTVVSERSVFACSEFDFFVGGNVYYDFETAVENCRDARKVLSGVEFTVRTHQLNQSTVEAQAIGNAYYPIRYMRRSGNITYFITTIDRDLTSIVTDTTSNWEILRVNLPNWSGMTSWGNPNQLIAWGDTLSPGLLSFSGVNDHWNWSANDDVLVGDNINDPIVFVAGDYDGQAVVFKGNEMIGYDGFRFTQISASDGLAASGAVIQLEKEMFWLDVDGPKMIKRRDFSGYSIEKLGSAMDPLFADWPVLTYGTDVVPYSINPAYKYKSLMTWNKRDNHIYLFFPEGSSTTNNRVALFNMNTRQWDGILTIPASTAGAYGINDTLRIIIGSPTDASISALSYTYNDDGVGIDGRLTSAQFFLTDERGFPVKSKLGALQLVYWGSAAIDTLWVDIDGDNATTRITPTQHLGVTPPKILTSTLRPSTENVSMYWQWDIYMEGTNSGSLFIPYDLYIELLPVERND